MPQEIERKFLVKSDKYKSQAFNEIRIAQAYLSSLPERTVRVRVKGQKAYITIKGIASENGLSRYEWEKEISVKDAYELFEICEPGFIDKTRFEVRSGQFIIEVDEFYAENEGLTVAEIELINEDDSFEKPDWLGEEVTGDLKYYNSMLMQHPYSKW